MEISKHYQENILKLESKYKSLIDDLLDEKILIQQKLFQSFENQMNKLFQLKLSILQKQQHYQSSRPLSSKQSIKHENSQKNQNMNENTINSTTASVDIPLSIKHEETQPTATNQNTNNQDNNDTSNSMSMSKSESTIVSKFDINKTNERMKNQICNHITRIEKTKNGEKYQCNDCSKKFKKLTQVQDHVARKHVNEKPFKCNQCDKSFGLWRHLSQHEACHSKKYQCNICGKKFSQKHNLKQHEPVHTGEKAFKCQHDGCGKSFTVKNTLVIHQRIHTGEKPFECDICHKKFRHAGSLNDHKVVIHTNEKPYKCDECNKCYALKKQLISHKNMHTSKYQCTICFKRHTRPSELKRHTESNHNMIDNVKFVCGGNNSDI